MGDVYLRRGGGGGKQALAPTITEISKTEQQIVFTITNNDENVAIVSYDINDTNTSFLEDNVTLNSSETSTNITINGLSPSTTYTVYAVSSVFSKVNSNETLLSITTLANPYTDATGGTILEYDLNGSRYRSHTFTENGDFVVTNVGDVSGNRNQIDYLIIGGGGQGGAGGGGGGGAGGYRTTNGTSGRNSSAESKITITATSYPIVVGAGAPADPGFDQGNIAGLVGSNSSAFNIISLGGGGGGVGVDNSDPNQSAGVNGGSGGGGGFIYATTSLAPGAGGTANQGYNGGAGRTATNAGSGGGGGGAGQPGSNGSRDDFGTSTHGGDGLSNILRTGSAEFRAGGGAGGFFGTTYFYLGGLGGGGNGGRQTSSPQNGVVNTGSGGGGGGNSAGRPKGGGGSGIVIIRYEIAPN